jgi:hypothetical protein
MLIVIKREVLKHETYIKYSYSDVLNWIRCNKIITILND